MERFRDYVVQRRTELRLSQRDLAKRGGMSHNTLGAIEAGRVMKAPDLDTLDCLAKGLGVPEDVLTAIARGRTQEEAWSAYESSHPVSSPALGILDNMGDLAYPPTADERATLAEADRLGLAFGLFTEPGFWNQPPEMRRRLLRDVEGTLEEARDMYRRMGRELPNGP